MEQVNDNSQRYVALDVFRGMTVAGMILVNNPGSWSHIFPPLRHAAWAGCTPTDLVFPFFLFCVGVAMAFSFIKYGDGINVRSSRKIIRRGVLIFLVGLGLNMFPFYPTSVHDEVWTFGQNWMYWLQHVRIFGVLQRIAMCYVVGAFLALWLKTPKRLVAGVAAVTVLHWVILYIFGGEPGWSTLEGNISGKIDIALVGENHVYHGYGIPFDPEGILGVISGSGTVLLGYLAGWTIRHTANRTDAVAKLFVFSAVCLALSQIWKIWLPVCKPMWTGSYVLLAGGWAMFCLAFFIYLVDIRGYVKPFTPFRAMGMNPLFAFSMAAILVKTLGNIVRWTGSDESSVSCLSWFYNNCCVSIFGNNEYASLMYAIVMDVIFLAMAMWLYRKKIIIKL